MSKVKGRNVSAIASQVRGCGRLARTDGRAQKCYRWEWANAALLRRHDSLSRDAAKGMARLMCKVALRRLAAKHGLSDERCAAIRAQFKARFVREDGPFCLGGINGAYWAQWGWNPSVIAHEVAHWADHTEAQICNERGERTGHGPQWLGWFAFLLIDVVRVDETALRASLKAASLRFTMP